MAKQDLDLNGLINIGLEEKFSAIFKSNEDNYMDHEKLESCPDEEWIKELESRRIKVDNG